MGFYRSYTQYNRYPIYHSWSLHGIYGESVETNIDFILNNDFSLNQWKFFPTQAKIDYALSSRYSGAPERQSKIILGRQLYSEGFDLFMLDGIRMPIFWSEKGGVSAQGGMARSLDMDSDTNAGALFGGFSLWEELLGFQVRGGLTAREDSFAYRHGYAAVSRVFSSGSLLTKQEWDLNSYAFNQSASEFTFDLSDRFSLRFMHAFLNPRPTERRQISNFVYRVLALSPTESVGADFLFQISEGAGFGLSSQSFSYQAGLKKEFGDHQELTTNLLLADTHAISLVLTHLASYGGTLEDFGMGYSYAFSERKQIQLEMDFGYLRKTNGISGVVSHARSAYQTAFGERMKMLFGIEVERNQYFEFDARAMAYVTSYL